MRKDSNPVLWPDELSHTVTTASFPYQEHGSQSCPSQSTVLAILGYLMTPSRLTPTRLPPHGPPVCQGHFSDQHQLSESVLNPHSDQLLITPATILTAFFPHCLLFFNLTKKFSSISYRGLHIHSLLVFLQFVPFPSFEGNSFNKVINDSTIKWSSVTPEKVTCSA